MKITIDEIKRLAKLSALSIENEKIDKMIKDFEQISEFVDQVTNVNIDEPDLYEKNLKIDDLRDDIIMPSLSQDEILANAPEKGEGAFIVPKVVD